MRLTSSCFGLLIIGLLLISAREVAAQEAPGSVNVYTNTYIFFDDNDGIVYGEAEAYTDYLYSVYYTISVNATLEGDNGDSAYGGNYDSGQGESHPGTQAWVSLEASADTNYTITGDYTVDFGFEDEYGYYDYYNFEQYEFEYIDAVDWYDFYGYLPQPPNYYGGGSSYSHLGKTHSNKKVGKPHHVVVVADNTNPISCSRVQRILIYKVVDQGGHGTGRTRVEELNYSFQDSCSFDFKTVGGSCFDTAPDGTFQDTINTGCPSPEAQLPCGFDYPNQFSWCEAPSDSPKIAIATVHAEVRNSYIKVNGTQSYNIGTPIFP